MAWVDVKEDAGNIVSDAASIPGNRLAGEAEYVKARANQIAEPAIKYKNDFVEKGKREGYGEAIWQDVVLPVAGVMPDETAGTLAGAGSAFALDLIDPTPGINPMNIAGGALGGYAGGVAGGLAYDAAEALSSPNSVLRGDTWKRAGEGAKIAFMGDEQGNLDVSNIPGNIAEGVGNIYQGGLAGVNQLGSDVSGFFGADEMEARLQKDADTRRGQMGKNSAVGAMAEELSYDAGMGGVLGRGVDRVSDLFGGIRKFSQGNMLSAGTKNMKEIAGKLQKQSLGTNKPLSNIAAMKKASDIARGTSTMYPGTKVAADLIGTFSKKGQDFIEDNWNAIASIAGSGKASGRYYNDFVEKMHKTKLLTAGERTALMSSLKSGTSLGGVLKNSLNKAAGRTVTRTNRNAAKLLGIGTGILADVDDNPGTRPTVQSLMGGN